MFSLENRQNSLIRLYLEISKILKASGFMMIDSLVSFTGLDQNLIIVALTIFGLVLARWGWKNPWNFLRLTIIRGILGVATYGALQLVDAGTSSKKAMVQEKSIE